MAITAKKLPSGNWRARVFYKDASGKECCESFTAETKKEAEFLAAQFRAVRKEQTNSKLTLRAASERYIDSKRNVVSPSTVRGYMAILRNYAQDIMPLRITDITQEAVQISINKLAANHSPKTCRNVHGFISAVLGVYRPDFILHTTLPKRKRNDIYVPDGAEVEQILQLARGTINEVPVFLAAECGLRASEIAALRVENVKPDCIQVKEAAVLDENGTEQVKAPKSYTSYREVPIAPEVSAYLIAQAQDGRVCPRRAVNICNNWDKFREKHDCINDNLNFHALRHHYASKCLLMNIPQKYIAELMGHSSTDMIEKVYQHIFPSAMEEFAEKIRAQMVLPK
ncbi:MAG: tyrosine-type recombinase/integrase [Oscillospiraceae bacterium]